MQFVNKDPVSYTHLDVYKRQAFWSLLFLIPFAVIFGGHIALEHLIEVTLGDYLTFIVLLFGLFLSLIHI